MDGRRDAAGGLAHGRAPADDSHAGHAHATGPDRLGPALGWLLALAALAAAAGFASRLPDVVERNFPEYVRPWVETVGVSLAFRVDGLSMVFALLITVFGAAIAIYSTGYLKGHPHLARFFVYLALFMVGMVGLVTADDLILLLVFWELTTISSFLLIGFEHREAKSRRNAWQALLITGAGGLCLFAAVVLLATATGTTRLSAAVLGGGLADHALYPAILTLVLLGAFAKSAQIPLHFWLPNAMAAPTPVSAYLHSATMVKAGVYLLARLHPALAGTEAWQWSLSLAGGATMLVASFLALKQTDLKLALAYTSLMALGALVMFLGSDARIAVAAAMTFLIVHALYKASLFLVVGAIDHETGTREISKLGGLWRTMPMTSIAAVLAAGSMAGFPPFLGFVGKELKYEGALAIAEEPWALAGAAVMANALMVALALIIIFRVIFGPAGDTPRKPHEASIRLWGPPLALASFGLVFGVAPELAGDALVQPAVTAILGRPEVVQLKLWHGVNLPLLMSVATVAIGAAFYLARGPAARALSHIPEIWDRGWDALLSGVQTGFAAITRTVQPGSLRIYLSVTFLALSLPALTALLTGRALAWPAPPGSVGLIAIGAAALAALGAVAAASAVRRMTAVGGLGAAGVGVAMLFVIFGAPDVAMTQALVDVLLIVLIAAVMLRVPELTPRRTGRLAAAAVAVVVGAAVTALTLAAVSTPFDTSLTDEIAARSYPDAHGRNIVNVILVDFRALDTFGEIVVVAAAAIGAYALIRTRPLRKASP